LNQNIKGGIVNFKLIKFDNLLNNLKQKMPLEENLSKIIRDIEVEFKFQSLGIFLKIPNTEIYRLKISRNISHHYAKTAIFTSKDEIIQKLSATDLLNIKSQKEFKFEKDFTNLLIIPIFYKNELFGFIFMDTKGSHFTNDEITKLCMFSSVTSLIVKIFMQQHEIDELTELDEVTQVYSYKSFCEHSEYIMSHIRRYKRNLALIIVKIDNYDKIIKTIGKVNANNLNKEIADTLKEKVRNSDVIGKIYRDTFAILMPETSINDILTPINRLNQILVTIPIMKNWTISWGIAEYNKNVSTIEDFLRIAEEAAFESTRKSEEKITISKS